MDLKALESVLEIVKSGISPEISHYQAWNLLETFDLAVGSNARLFQLS